MEEVLSSNDSNETDCQVAYDSTEYKILAVVRASVGFLSFIACLGVVVIILVFKKHRVFIQRLVLYLAITAMIHSISYCTARVNYYTPRPILDDYCYFGGLFNHYTAAVELVSIWCIMISIFVNALFQRSTQKLEIAFVLATFLGPGLWFWVPVWLKSYGTSGGWCGIRFLNADCSRYNDGTFIQFGIWYIPLYISLVAFFLGMVIVAVKSVHDVLKWHGHYDPVAKQMKQILTNEIKPLIWYPIIYLLFNSFSLISQIYQAVHPNDPSIFLTYLRVISSPLRGAVIALAYTLDKHTRRRLTPTHCRALCHEFRYGDKIEEYETMTGVSDSYPGPRYVQYNEITDMHNTAERNSSMESIN